MLLPSGRADFALRDSVRGAVGRRCDVRRRGCQCDVALERSVTNRSPEKRRWRAGLGSEGVGQDKRPHIAARSVGCFCWPYFALRQGGAWARNVRLTINALPGFVFWHIAEAGWVGG
jgi:hypothetical protein